MKKRVWLCQDRKRVKDNNSSDQEMGNSKGVDSNVNDFMISTSFYIFDTIYCDYKNTLFIHK